MQILRFVAWMIAVGLTVLGTSMAFGQKYPNKPIRVVAPTPGGIGDLYARLIAQGISGSLGQPVIVENRPSNLIGDMMARATPDGYTVGFASSGAWVNPLLQKMSYDPVRDLSAITWVTATPFILVVHPTVPANSVNELIALARARPGQLNYASGSIGGESHLGLELFKTMAGVNIVHVPYKGAGPALVDLLAGQGQLSLFPAAITMPHIKSGKLRALAVTSAQPSALVPGLPTVAAGGLPGYECIVILGIFGPGGIPATIINVLNQQIVRVFNRADVKETVFNSGSEVVGSSPAEFAAKIKSEVAKWGKVIKDANIKIDQ